jgi:RNA polymerase sigma factor (sigma-70 family)
MTDSQQLLAEYARSGSDTAFRELVGRYVNLVYSTALRVVAGDTHRAEDVSQTVFADLARQARTLPAAIMLGGWLHRHTCFVAAHTLRGERRRQSRERQAVEMNALQNDSGADFSPVAPILDEAINELDEADRTAILLRFFEERDFRSVGEALGGTEDGARMRVNRALEKLHGLLKRRGITTTVAALGAALSASAVQAAPVGLAVTVATAALAGTITTATIATQATMHWINLKSIAAIATAAFAAGTTVFVVQQGEIRRLQDEHRALAAQVESQARERDAALTAAAQANDEAEQRTKDNSELLRLRGEVGVLRRQISELTELEAEDLALLARVSAESNPTSSAVHGLLSPEAGMNGCINNLRMIEAAMQQCALENNLTASAVVTAEQIVPYFLDRKLPQCPSGGFYRFGGVTNLPTCSIPGHALPPMMVEEAPDRKPMEDRVIEALLRHYGVQLSLAEAKAEAADAYTRDHGRAPSGGEELMLYLNPRFQEPREDFKRSYGRPATNTVELGNYLRSRSN